MRDDCEGHEPRSGKLIGKPKTKAITDSVEAYDEGYDRGFEAGIEEGKRQMMEMHLLMFHTGGTA
jgi:hypothetical protein